MIQRKVHKTGLWATTILFIIVIISYYALFEMHLFRQRYVIEVNIIPEDSYYDFSEYTCINIYADSSKIFWWRYEGVEMPLQKILKNPEKSQRTFLKNQNKALRDFCIDMTTQQTKIFLNLKIHRQCRVKQFIDILDELIVTNKIVNNTNEVFTNSIDITSDPPKYSIAYRVVDYTPEDDSLILSYK